MQFKHFFLELDLWYREAKAKQSAGIETCTINMNKVVHNDVQWQCELFLQSMWLKRDDQRSMQSDMQSESWKLKVSHTKWTKKVESWHGRFILVLHGEPWPTQWVPKVDRRNAERSFIAAVISKCLVTGVSTCLLLLRNVDAAPQCKPLLHQLLISCSCPQPTTVNCWST